MAGRLQWHGMHNHQGMAEVSMQDKALPSVKILTDLQAYTGRKACAVAGRRRQRPAWQKIKLGEGREVEGSQCLLPSPPLFPSPTALSACLFVLEGCFSLFFIIRRSMACHCHKGRECLHSNSQREREEDRHASKERRDRQSCKIIQR